VSRGASARVRLLVGLLGTAATSCDPQTDLVAIEAPQNVCPDAASCTSQGSCAARNCARDASKSAFCSAQTSPVEVGDGCTSPAATTQTFRFAICSCTDLVTIDPLQVDGPNPTAIAVNGALRVEAGVRIEGSVRVGAALRSSAQAAPTITGSLSEHTQPNCACGEASLLDVGAAAAAYAGDNDNADAKLDSVALDGFSGTRELDLACGRYHLSRIAGSGALRLRVHGRVALGVDGNVELDDEFVVTLDSGAQLTLFVAGNMRVAGRLELSTPDSPSSLRLLVGGNGTVDLGSDALIVGTLYAPRAELVTRGRFELTGAVFVRRAAPGAELIVHYDPITGDPAANGCSR
jgi:hypothetical protein